MRYLQCTEDSNLTFKHSDDLRLVGYSDSDFAGCLDHMESIFGYVFTLIGEAISWKSVKPTHISSSTM